MTASLYQSGSSLQSKFLRADMFSRFMVVT